MRICGFEKGTGDLSMEKVWALLKDIFQVIFFAAVLTLVLRSFVIDARQIPSESMVPTLQIGDRLLVDKIIYKFTDLHRGDIIVFAPPPEARTPELGNDDLIKRIIGLPGDKIQVQNGIVYINNKPLDEPYIAEKPTYTYGPETVPEDTFFMMGDNRNRSFDSHAWGFMPQENVKGRAFVRYWPLNRMAVVH